MIQISRGDADDCSNGLSSRGDADDCSIGLASCENLNFVSLSKMMVPTIAVPNPQNAARKTDMIACMPSCAPGQIIKISIRRNIFSINLFFNILFKR